MADRLVIDCSTGQASQVPIDDQWIRDRRKNQILITVANTSKVVNESETISLQLVTHPLLDGTTRENVALESTVTMQFGKLEMDVELDSNGAWSQTLDCAYVGTFTIQALSHVSNPITMTVSEA